MCRCRQARAGGLTHAGGLGEPDDLHAAVADDGADAELATVVLEVVHVPVLVCVRERGERGEKEKGREK